MKKWGKPILKFFIVLIVGMFFVSTNQFPLFVVLMLAILYALPSK